MKKTLLIVVCALLAGCDYTVELVQTPEIDIDKEALGLWERKNEQGHIERLLVLPLSEKEYLVSFPAGQACAMFAQACFWRQDDLTLVQLDWVGNVKGQLPAGNRRFQYASYLIDDEELRVRMLNAEFIDREIKSADKLIQAIMENKDSEELFQEVLVFKNVTDQSRCDPEKQGGTE